MIIIDYLSAFIQNCLFNPILLVFEWIYSKLNLRLNNDSELKLVNWLIKHPSKPYLILARLYLFVKDIIAYLYLSLPIIGIYYLVHFLITANIAANIKIRISIILIILFLLILKPTVGLQGMSDGGFYTIIDNSIYVELKPQVLLLFHFDKFNSNLLLDYYYLILVKRLDKIIKNKYNQTNINLAKQILFKSIKPNAFTKQYFKKISKSTSNQNLFKRSLNKLNFPYNAFNLDHFLSSDLTQIPKYIFDSNVDYMIASMLQIPNQQFCNHKYHANTDQKA